MFGRLGASFGRMGGSLGGAQASLPPLEITRTMGVTTFSKSILDEFDAWNGASAGITGLYTNHDTWTNFEANVDVWIAEYDGDTRPRLLMLPLNTDESTLASVVAGDHDASFTYFLTEHLAAYPAAGPIFVAPGWEFNFLWSWSDDPENFVPAYRRVVELGRSISPRFKFIWAPGMVAGHAEPIDPYWPGKAWVDVVGFTYYAKASNEYPSAADEWETAREQAEGLDAKVLGRAESEGLPLCIVEYGTDYDDPDTVTLVGALVAAEDFLFHIWFDNNEDANFDTRISDDSLFEVGEAFVGLYGVPAYGASAVQPVHITSGDWGDSNVSTSGIRVSSTGNEFGYRSYWPDAGIDPGAYQLQVLYEYVDPNSTAFVPLSTDGAATQNVGFTINGTTPTPYADQGSGFTNVSMTELDDGKLLLQADITIDAHAGGFNCGIGPMSTTNGRAVDVHGFRLRQAL